MSPMTLWEGCCSEKYQLDPDWRAFKFETHDTYYSLTGAVCTEKYKSGKRKGKPNWSKRDKSTEATYTVSMSDYESWVKAWEKLTGLCSRCIGEGKTVNKISKQPDGTFLSEYKDCPKCNGSGKNIPNPPPPPDPPVCKNNGQELPPHIDLLDNGEINLTNVTFMLGVSLHGCDCDSFSNCGHEDAYVIYSTTSFAEDTKLPLKYRRYDEDLWRIEYLFYGKSCYFEDITSKKHPNWIIKLENAFSRWSEKNKVPSTLDLLDASEKDPKERRKLIDLGNNRIKAYYEYSVPPSSRGMFDDIK